MGSYSIQLDTLSGVSMDQIHRKRAESFLSTYLLKNREIQSFFDGLGAEAKFNFTLGQRGVEIIPERGTSRFFELAPEILRELKKLARVPQWIAEWNGGRPLTKRDWARGQEFVGDIREIFREKLGIDNRRVFQKIWDQAKDAGRLNWDGPLTVDVFDRIEAALRETLIYSGKGIEVEGTGADERIHEIVQYLLGRGKASSEWVNGKMIRGILLKGDPELLKEVRDEIRVVLQSCAAQLPQAGTAEEGVFHAFVGNVVALLPFFYPGVGEEFLIPQKVDGAWKVVSYKVDQKLELTPRWFSSPISALGLTSADGPPLLSFLGTTFPAGEGFIATLFSDFTPGMSVGHAPYLTGRKEIGKWLEGKGGVRLFGMSLGGALTLQVLRHHQEKIAQVNAYNPAGLYPWNWNGFENKSEVNIFYQENDLVATLGSFPEGDQVHVYRVIPEMPENFLKAHARVYTGSEKVTLIKSDAQYENGRLVRKLLTALHLILGALLVLPILICFYLLYILIVKALSLLSV